MPKAARLNDTIKGITSGEHNGHIVPHAPCELNGTITSGSNNVFINGKQAAFIISNTKESDCCDSNVSGTLKKGSSTVFINGKSVCRIGDETNPHNGTAEIDSGSSNVFIG